MFIGTFSYFNMDFWNLIQNISNTLNNYGTMNTTNNTSFNISNGNAANAIDFSKFLSESHLFPTWKFAYIYHIMKTLASAIILMNGYILLLSVRQVKFRSKSNVLLANLAFVDLLVGALCIPLYIVSQKELEKALYRTYIQALRMHIATNNIIQTTSLLTVSNLFLIIAERCVSLQFPFRHRRWVTGFKIKASLVIMWIVAIVYSILIILIYWPLFNLGDLSDFSDIFKLAVATLQVSEKLDKYKVKEVYSSFLVLLTILSVVLLLMMFTTIYKRPMQTTANTGTNQIFSRIKRELKALKILSTMELTIIIWLSSTVYAFMGHHEKIHYATLYFGQFTISLTNPILFTFYKNDYRQALKEDFTLVKHLLGKLRPKWINTCLASSRRTNDLTQTKADKEMVRGRKYVIKEQALFAEYVG